MIIRLIAETEAEKKRFAGNEYVEHLNVKEYFIAGNKLDPEESIVDFHEWNGGYRYLIGTLGYFYEVINDDRRKVARQGETEMPVTIRSKQKTIPMVKRGFGGNIQQLDISKLRIQAEQEAQEAQEEGPDNAVEPSVEDQFVDGSNPKINFQVGEILTQDEVEVVAEDVANQLKREAEEFKKRQGLRIIPDNKE